MLCPFPCSPAYHTHSHPGYENIPVPIIVICESFHILRWEKLGAINCFGGQSSFSSRIAAVSLPFALFYARGKYAFLYLVRILLTFRNRNLSLSFYLSLSCMVSVTTGKSSLASTYKTGQCHKNEVPTGGIMSYNHFTCPSALLFSPLFFTEWSYWFSSLPHLFSFK